MASVPDGSPPPTRLEAIDLLRFIAALMVLLYHYISSYIAPIAEDYLLASTSRVTRYGYLGVDLFFMISGFVIVWSAYGRSATDFVISRVSRLYPTFWVAMLLTSLAIVVLGPFAQTTTPPDITGSTLAANATMMPQLFGVPRIDSVYWTLEYEIRFYFLVFLLLAFRQIGKLEYWLYAWLASCVLSLVVPVPKVFSYFLLISYAPLFIAGGLFFVVFRKGWSYPRVVAILVSLIISLQGSLEKREGFLTPDPASWWIVPAVTASFFLLFLLLVSYRQSWCKPAVAYRLGALTYPLYLTHALIGRLIIDLSIENVGPWGTLLLVTILSMILAQLLVVLVDEPARRPLARLLRSVVRRVSRLAAARRRQLTEDELRP